MYTTCLFCHAALGHNEAVESFPIGRRLAFDASKGRLWVVCKSCERWNLTPLEERWEAIEQCERLFSDTRLRVSTDNIGLAKLREGLELVRIGAPQRPEMAAWRYGDQFGKRRQRHLLYTGIGITALVGVSVAGPLTGVIAGGGWGIYNIVNFARTAYEDRKVRARLVLPGTEGAPVIIRRKQLNVARLTANGAGDFALHLEYLHRGARHLGNGRILDPRLSTDITASVDLTGDEAMKVAGRILPAVNVKGGKREEVQEAVKVLEDTPDPRALYARMSRFVGDAPRSRRGVRFANARSAPQPGSIAALPLHIRLALEMAAHEETERRALEGELTLLEDAWREAEQIAGIADDLLLPDDTEQKLRELKGV